MKRLLLSSILVVLGATGCASSSTARQGSGEGLALGHAATEPLRVTGSAVTGPSSSMAIAENGLQGRFQSRPVMLQWDYQRMTGTVNSQPAALELAEGDDTRVWGVFGKLPVDLTVDAHWLQGRVGECRYALRRTADGFQGMRHCGESLERDIDIAFPEPLMERSLGQRTALLTLALASLDTSKHVRTPLIRVGRIVEPIGNHRNRYQRN